MTTAQTLDVIRVLLNHIGDDPEQDKALAQGALVILNGMDPEPKKVVKKKPTPSMGDETPKKREPFDTGRLRALHKGGWSAAMIADEMGVTEVTVRNHAKKEGLRFGRTKAKETSSL